MHDQGPADENPFASPHADPAASSPLASPGLLNIFKAAFFGCLGVSMLAVLVIAGGMLAWALATGDLQGAPLSVLLAGCLGLAMVAFLGLEMLKSARVRLQRGRPPKEKEGE